MTDNSFQSNASALYRIVSMVAGRFFHLLFGVAGEPGVAGVFTGESTDFAAPGSSDFDAASSPSPS